MAAVTADIVIIAWCREYTGYMALHMADTGPPGAAWAFTPEWRLQQVRELASDQVINIIAGDPGTAEDLLRDC